MPVRDVKQYYKDNRAEFYRRQKVARLKRWENSVKVVNALKDNPCTDCHHKFPIVCMDFDHVLPGKYKDVSQMVYHNTLVKILEEIAKCELVCANCHRIRTETRNLAAMAENEKRVT